MKKSEQYEYFQSLMKTCDKLEKVVGKDKTTDEIIADISDPDSKASVIPNQGNPTTTSMTKGINPKVKSKEKGVHQPYSSAGVSMAGELSREGKNKSGKLGEQNKEVGREFHSDKLKELKNIKPNLPKSEEMSKAISDRSMTGGDSRRHQTGDEKGVHTNITGSGGRSSAGKFNTASKGKGNFSSDTPEESKEWKEHATEEHKKVLGEMKAMPKPNLPKSEEMSKNIKQKEEKKKNKSALARFINSRNSKKQSK